MENEQQELEAFFEKLGQKTVADAAMRINTMVTGAQVELMEKIKSLITASKSRITAIEATTIIANGGVVFAQDFEMPNNMDYWNPSISYMGKGPDDTHLRQQQPDVSIEEMKKGKYRMIIIVEPLGPIEDKD